MEFREKSMKGGEQDARLGLPSVYTKTESCRLQSPPAAVRHPQVRCCGPLVRLEPYLRDEQQRLRAALQVRLAACMKQTILLLCSADGTTSRVAEDQFAVR